MYTVEKSNNKEESQWKVEVSFTPYYAYEVTANKSNYFRCMRGASIFIVSALE